MITMTEWSHAWCKEGFATYSEALWFENQYGENYYHSYMASLNGIGYADFQLYDIEPPLHAAIYYKGAWVLHMLRHVLGDPAFFNAIYAYVNDPAFRYGVADTDDMCASFEDATGVELSWFFEQWIYNPGAPHYELAWWADETADGYDVTVAVNQIQSIGPIFRMPVDVRINTLSGAEMFVVWDSLQTQVFHLHSDEEPLMVRLDPYYWILRHVSPAGIDDLRHTPTVTLRPNVPNPFRNVTALEFHIGTASHVTLDIFDVAGRHVSRLLDGLQLPGPERIVWNGRDIHGAKVAPGVYYCRLRAGERISSRPILVIR
jgi:hypothetical protein